MVLDPSNEERRISTRYFDIPPLVNVYDIATGPSPTDPHGVPILDRGAQNH